MFGKKLLKIFAAALCAFSLTFAFAGCGKGDGNETAEPPAPEITGEFYTLQEAYDNGYLTQEDLKSIAYYHNGGRKYNEDIMDESYTPATKSPEKLESATERAISKNFFDKYIGENNLGNITLNEVGIGENCYYGTYNGYVAVMVWRRGPYNTMVGDITLSGVRFFYPDNNRILIWRSDENNQNGKEKDGTFYTLQKAYDNGYLSQDDLKSIAYYHNNSDAGYNGSLDKTTENAIKKAGAKYWAQYESTTTAQDITLNKYFGTYSGYYAVKIECISVMHPADVPNYSLYIGGVEFIIHDYDTLGVFKKTF